MTAKEYELKKRELELEFKSNVLNLNTEFAHANNSIKQGDIIEDHIGKIRVESIMYGCIAYGTNLPICIYSGQTLKKDGTETIKKEKREIYQSNLKL